MLSKCSPPPRVRRKATVCTFRPSAVVARTRKLDQRPKPVAPTLRPSHLSMASCCCDIHACRACDGVPSPSTAPCIGSTCCSPSSSSTVRSRWEPMPEQRRRRERRRRRPLPHVFPTCAVAVSLVIPPIVISALQVQVQHYPPLSVVGRRKQGSKPPSWIAATSSNAGTSSGTIMYNVRTDDFDEDSVLNDYGSGGWLGGGGSISTFDVGGANRFQSSLPAGTRPLTKLIAQSGDAARRKSYAKGTALKASQYGSGNGDRRKDRAAKNDFGGLGGVGGNNSRRIFTTNESSTSTGRNPQIGQIHTLRQTIMRHIRQQNLSEAYQLIEEMILSMKSTKRDGDNWSNDASAIVDETIRSLAEMAFSRAGGGKEAANRIALGLDALHLQLSPQSNVVPPHNSIPRATWIKALRALTSVRGVRRLHLRADDSTNGNGSATTPADASFGILQRLITGAGVRRPTSSGADSSTMPNESDLDERDFSMVLNAFVSSGRMDMAHRVVALQERTKSAPPLSPVAYSIMIKGYGKLQDAKNIEMMLSHAKRNGIVPDTIMYNSLIDAYINCNLVEEAQKAFSALTDQAGSSMESTPTPNIRSYNTMLKGYARNGELRKALELSQSMDSAGLWNEVTTNTLVKAAVVAGEFEAAEDILAKFTIKEEGQGDARNSSNQRRSAGGGSKRHQHPNMEAYTDLIDGYGKAMMLDKAIGTFKSMRQRGVEPNEYSYTCLISAMARNGKMEEANALLNAMESANVRPTTITYNAFIAAALGDAPLRVSSTSDVGPDSSYLDEEHRQYNNRIVDSLKLLGRMVKSKVRPNEITISTIVGGMGKCYPPRIDEAKSIVAKLSADGTISPGDERIGTALIHTCGDNGDFEGSLEAYNAIVEPDIIALNAFLDACCKCGKVKMALEIFEATFSTGAAIDACGSGRKSNRRSRLLRPDVVSYTALIAALLEMGSPAASQRAHKLYDDMKSSWGIAPDKALIDIILSAMVGGGSLGLESRDIDFIREVLRDAEGVQGWAPNQLEERIKEIRFLLLGRLSEAWKNDEAAFGIDDSSPPSTARVDSRDPLFEKKGWNTVDSGFRLWGGGFAGIGTSISKTEGEDTELVDSFLQQHGWNSMSDNGFRIF